MKSCIILFTALTIFRAIGALASNDDPFYTTALPEPDRADLYIVPNSIMGSNPEAHLDTKAARYLASLVRSQSIGQFGMRCNHPRYGIRFYRDGKLIASETICFECQWINPVSSETHAVTPSEGFDAATPQSKELEAYLKKTIPLVLK